MVKLGVLNPDGTVSSSIEVKQAELGVNCWLPARFLGGCCPRHQQCKYPEKVTCKAVAKKSQREDPCGKMTYSEGTGWVCEDCFVYPCFYLGEEADSELTTT